MEFFISQMILTNKEIDRHMYKVGYHRISKEEYHQRHLSVYLLIPTKEG
jgi:hypothetical protein